MNSLVRFCILMALGTNAGAFAPNGAPIRDPTALKASRKEFFEQASAAGLALVMASAPAFADDGGMDDLSMPSEEEQQKAAVSERTIFCFVLVVFVVVGFPFSRLWQGCARAPPSAHSSLPAISAGGIVAGLPEKAECPCCVC